MSVQTVTPTDELESATGVIDRLLGAVADRATRDALGAILGALGRSHEAAIAWLAIKERTIHGPDVELSTWSDGPTISDSGITLAAQRGGIRHSWWIRPDRNGNGWRHGCATAVCPQCGPDAFEPSFTGAWLSTKDRVETVFPPAHTGAPVVVLDS